MSSLWIWPTSRRRAIIAVVAALFFALNGVLAASAGAPSAGNPHGLWTIGTDRQLCLPGEEGRGAPPVLPQTHCPDPCCQTEHDTASAPNPIEIAAASLPIEPGVRTFDPRRMDERPPSRASGWASSWSSRAPPNDR